MRRTPPVVVHLPPQPAVQVAAACIALLSSGGLAAWLLSHWPSAWPVLLIVPLSVGHAWRAAAVRPRRLRWDGQAWWLAEPGEHDEAQVRLAVVFDLDSWLLLRAQPGPRWLPLSRAGQPGWGSLRATLFAARGGGAQR